MSQSDPITVSSSRTAKPGCEAAFERALHDFVQRSLSQPGQLGVHIMRPAPGSASREYGIIRKLTNRNALMEFRTSPEYLAWNNIAVELTEGAGRTEELCGLESWFTSPGTPLRPLPKWKMALVTFVGVYVITTLLTLAIGPAIREWPLLSREEALRLYTQGSSWFSSESGKKGAIVPGQLADLVALTDDYFAVPEEQIKGIESVLTVVGGKIVHATDEFVPHAPPPISVFPEWSPVKMFGGYGAPLDIRKAARAGVPMPQHQHSVGCHEHGCVHAAHQLLAGIEAARNRYAGFFGLGCDCFAF